MVEKNKTTESSVQYWLDDDITARYLQYRPVHSKGMVKAILQYLLEGYTDKFSLEDLSTKTCVDVGCGSGQGTRIWAPYFGQVYGFDISSNQIKQAQSVEPHLTNVIYQVSKSEDIPLPEGSVQLITCFHSIHWFDQVKFFAECERLLVPGGVISMVSFTEKHRFHFPDFQDLPETETMLKHFTNIFLSFTEKLGPFWNDKSFVSHNKYVDLHIPYKEKKYRCDEDTTNLNMNTTLKGFLGYLSTWSVLTEYRKCHCEELDILDQLSNDFLTCINDAVKGDTAVQNNNVNIIVTFATFYLLNRKPLITNTDAH